MAVTYNRSQRLVALSYGLLCHVTFVAGIAAMVASLYSGMRLGHGPFSGLGAFGWDVFLVIQFAFLHSFLLTDRGRRFLAKLAPAELGRPLASTTFALISSLQLLITFGAWSQLGGVWWEPHGWLRWIVCGAYAASWGFLLKAMHDAGLATQTGFLGWGAIVRNREPSYGGFTPRGTFRYVRQPIYLAFACTLWTGPVWTPDHLLLALAWTSYCVFGPRLKERRYLRVYGERFARYREAVPYWLPRPRQS
jgi:protein-S-isoprenylcysteine O-methyltransferase Ste14